jgi:hypothetical protein
MSTVLPDLYKIAENAAISSIDQAILRIVRLRLPIIAKKKPLSLALELSLALILTLRESSESNVVVRHVQGCPERYHIVVHMAKQTLSSGSHHFVVDVLPYQ